MPRYTFEEKDPINSTRVFRVRTEDQPHSWQGTDVWTDKFGPDAKIRCYCTECSGPLSAMLSTCKHAQALKRHIEREARSKV